MRWHRTAEVALLALALCASAHAGAGAKAHAPAGGRFFDDFSHTSVAQLRAAGWQLRDQGGHPGVPGATWSADAVNLVDDPARRGNRLLRLRAQTDGTAAGTQQAQICQQRKFLRGTYAARVRFSDAPVAGHDGDPVVQAFYAISPLAHDLDPSFSEVDFEYLPNGGWGSEKTRLYGISWHTVQIEPWRAFNQASEAFGSHAGWHQLTVQVTATSVHHFIDGRLLNRASGRHVPAVPMALNLSLWFSPGGLLPASAEPRVYEMDLDWLLHVRDRTLSPAQMRTQAQGMRRRGITRHDTLPPGNPVLPSPCNL